MAKPNYQFEKRQRELAKKQKKAEKENRKTHPSSGGDRDGGSFASTAPNDGPSDAGGNAPALPTGGR
jgi:hypothetical protein